MTNTKGTPRSMKQAISNGISLGLNKPLMSLPEEIERHVKDYVAQKFTATICNNEEHEKMLKNLFNLIFPRDNK